MNTGNHIFSRFLSQPVFLKTNFLKKTALAIALSLSFLISQPYSANAQQYTTATIDEVLKVVEKHKGEVVLLNVFASWCPPCVQETKTFAQFYNKYPPKSGIYLIGVSLDEDVKELSRFISSKGISYPVYHCGQDFVDFFDVQTIPTLILFDREGKVAEYCIGIASMDELTKLVEKYK